MSDAVDATRFDRALRGACARGRMDAVFTHAASVATERGWVTLVDESRPLVPNGIACRFGEIELEVGREVTLNEGLLRIGGGAAIRLRGDGVSLKVQGPRASRHALEVQCRKLHLPDRTRALLRGQGRGTAAEETVIARVAAALRGIAAGLVSASMPGRFGAGGDGVMLLVGLGPGSTPTGDDVLTGLAAMAHRLRGSALIPSRKIAELLATLREIPEHATTPLSVAMLRHAALGSFVEPLQRLVSLLGDSTATAEVIQDAVGSLATVGAQTGQDMLAGVFALALATRSSPGGQA